jgi:dolichyl-phosphate beta-glucosyltransferase
MSQTPVKLSVVVPSYNEEERIERSIKAMLEYFDAQNYSYEMLVVSDGSSDKTNEIVTEMAKAHPQLKLLGYSPNRGKGYAVRYGMLKAEGEYVLFCDADLATPIEEIEKLWGFVEGEYEVAIGSRPLKESNLLVHQPWYREFLGRSFNMAVQLLAVRGIKDTQCGFKLFKRSASYEIFRLCRLNGFSFDIEVLFIARNLKYKIAEVPIRWAHQEGSKVKVFRDGMRMLRDILWLRVFMLFNRPSTVKNEQ